MSHSDKRFLIVFIFLVLLIPLTSSNEVWQIETSADSPEPPLIQDMNEIQYHIADILGEPVSIIHTDEAFEGYNMFSVSRYNLLTDAIHHYFMITDMDGNVINQKLLPWRSRTQKFINSTTILTGGKYGSDLWNYYTSEFVDLGIDVPKDKFITAVQEHKPAILGLGAYMSTTMLEMKEVIEELKDHGLRDSLKVMIGGVPTSQEFADEIGADAWGKDAMVAMERAQELIGGKND